MFLLLGGNAILPMTPKADCATSTMFDQNKHLFSQLNLFYKIVDMIWIGYAFQASMLGDRTPDNP